MNEIWIPIIEFAGFYISNYGRVRSENKILTPDKYQLIKTWPYATATNLAGLNAGNIVQVCKGKKKSAHGFKWQYA